MGLTKEDIKKGLRKLGLKKGDAVLVHSSLSSFGNAKVATPEKGCQLLRKSVDYIVEIIKSAWNFYDKKNTPQKGRINEP